jgi:hypothetical protein
VNIDRNRVDLAVDLQLIEEELRHIFVTSGHDVARRNLSGLSCYYSA